MFGVFLRTSDHWDGPWWGGVVFLLLFALIVGVIFVKLVWWRPWRWRGGWEAPEEILKRRLASGQISEAEYQHLSELVKRG